MTTFIIEKITRKGEGNMARIPVVSRTMETTVAKVLVVNVNSQTTEEMEVSLPRTYKNNDVVLKRVRNLMETEDLKVVHIISTEVKRTKYAMSEQKFIENAETETPIE